MVTLLTELISNVFRPSVAALAIAAAVAIVTIDDNKQVIGVDRVDVTDFSCNGLFKPFCMLVGR